MLAHVAADRLAPHVAHDLRLAQHRPAHGLIGKCGRLEIIEDDIVGGIFRLADFLQHHGALAGQLLGIECGMLQDVGDDIDGQRHIAGQDPGVIGGLLARGIGVEMAAHGLDLLGDFPGAAPGRALEGHMLQQMGDAVDLGRLVARAHIGPDADGGGFDRIHPVAGDPKAVGKPGDLDRHAALPAATWSRIWASTAARSLASTVNRSGRR